MIRLCLLLISLFSASSQSQQITNEQLTVGNKITIQSEVLKEQRELLVYLPKNYDATNRYPVIYVLDGEFYFIPTIGVVSSLSATKAIPESIVVAIPTRIRVRDYLPPIKGEAQSNQQQFIKQKFPRFGGTEKFQTFLMTEVFTYIDSHYSTLPNRTLIGHSNGGVFSLHTLLSNPDLFTNYLVISPAPWWGDAEIDSNFASIKELTLAKNLFITLASEPGRYYAHMMRILANLKSHAPNSFQWQYQHLAEHTHESSVYPAIYAGLTYLFNDFKYSPSEELAKYGDVSPIIDYYEGLSKKYGYTVDIPHSVLAQFSSQQLELGRNEQAFETLNYFVKHNPKVAYAHQSLAFAYMRTGQYLKAKEGFSHALTLYKKNGGTDYTVVDFLNNMISDANTKLMH